MFSSMLNHCRSLITSRISSDDGTWSPESHDSLLSALSRIDLPGLFVHATMRVKAL